MSEATPDYDWFLPVREPRWPRDIPVAAAEKELAALARDRGRGETLTLHGDIGQSSTVVIWHPRAQGPRALVPVAVPSEGFPALRLATEAPPPQPENELLLLEEAFIEAATKGARETVLEMAALQRPPRDRDDWWPNPEWVVCAMIIRHALGTWPGNRNWTEIDRILGRIAQAAGWPSLPPGAERDAAERWSQRLHLNEHTRAEYDVILAYGEALRAAREVFASAITGTRLKAVRLAMARQCVDAMCLDATNTVAAPP